MKRLVNAFASLLFLCSSSQAQTSIDVSKITCEQYSLFKVSDPQKIAIWMSGYYHGMSKNVILDKQRLEENAEKLAEFCYFNRKTQLLEAVRRVIGSK